MTRKTFLSSMAAAIFGVFAFSGCKSVVDVNVVGAKKCCAKKCDCPCPHCQDCCKCKPCGCVPDKKCCEICTCCDHCGSEADCPCCQVK